MKLSLLILIQIFNFVISGSLLFASQPRTLMQIFKIKKKSIKNCINGVVGVNPSKKKRERKFRSCETMIENLRVDGFWWNFAGRKYEEPLCFCSCVRISNSVCLTAKFSVNLRTFYFFFKKKSFFTYYFIIIFHCRGILLFFHIYLLYIKAELIQAAIIQSYLHSWFFFLFYYFVEE